MKRCLSALFGGLLLLASCETETMPENEQEQSSLEQLQNKKEKSNNADFDICHYSEVDDKYFLLSVNQRAWKEHKDHGDVRLDDKDEDGFVPDNECEYGNMGDCDDSDADINPDAEEILDNEVDENCDGVVGKTGVTPVFYRDTDGDGFGDPDNIAEETVEVSDGIVLDNTDCNDGDPDIYPGAPEICDGKVNDCNSENEADFGLPTTTYYVDADKDGYGAKNDLEGEEFCKDPGAGYSITNDDCDDSNGTINPDASEICGNAIDENCNDAINEGFIEICDGIDNNCDGVVDEGFDKATWYFDGDNDTYGDDSNTMVTCYQPEGYIARGGDCDDSNGTINPDASEICGNAIDENCNDAINEGFIEICDGIDNNCDGVVDEGFDKATWYFDGDNDTYGDDSNTMLTCYQPEGYISRGGDCDDNNGTINPDASEICGNAIDENCNDAINEGFIEICDGIDNNCDGVVDEGFDKATWYFDGDNDTYGDDSNTMLACYQPEGYVARGGDCNDSNSGINPGASEVCGNSVDENCDEVAKSCSSGPGKDRK